MGYRSILLAVLTVLSVVFAEEGCPPANAIAPCKCDGEGVGCMGDINLAQIRRTFRENFTDGGGMYVYIQGTQITSIPSDLFGNYKAENFYIEVNKINNVDMKCFDHTAKYIKSISFFGNQLLDFEFDYIPKCPKLYNINLARNKLKKIPNNAFIHNYIVNIQLAENEINSIGTNAFLNCPNLRKLDLSSNKLTSLSDYSLALTSSVPGLQMNLMGNQISHISSTALQSASPQILFLTQNRLSVLKSDVFLPLVSRMSQHGGLVEVSGNPFSCNGCNDHSWIVDNKYVLGQMIIGFSCPDGTGLVGLTKSYVGC